MRLNSITALSPRRRVMSIRNTVLALAVVPLALSAAAPASAGFLGSPIGGTGKSKFAGPAFIGVSGKGPGNLFGGGSKGTVLGGGLKSPGNIVSGPGGRRNGIGGPANIAIGPAKGPGTVLDTVFAGPAKAASTVVGTVFNGPGNTAGAQKDTGDRKPAPAPASSHKGDKNNEGNGNGSSPSWLPSLVNTYSSASDGSGLPTIAPAGSASITPAASPSSAPVASASCLVKEYLQAGVVLFRDVCAKEWAMNSTSATNQVASAETRACLTKEYPRAGMVLFKDTCTDEWAMNLPDRRAQASQEPHIAEVR
jgi:hypothetical protein